MRNVLDSKYDLGYCVECVMGWQLEFMDKSGRTNVQDIKITYPINELVKHLPDETAIGECYEV